MASLDTNCLLRWFLDDIPEQCQRVEALLLAKMPLVVDDAAIIESIFALEVGGRLSRQLIRGFIDTAAAQPITMDRALWAEILDVWVGHPKLSVVDVYLATKAKANGNEPLYTFDAKLINQMDCTAAVPSS